MHISSFGNSADGRPQVLIGLTPADFVHLTMEGAVYLNKQETEDSPLPMHLIFMMGEDNAEIEARVDGWIEKIREERGDGWIEKIKKERSDGEDDV